MVVATFVKEERRKYTDYQLFKKLYYYFLEEFIMDLFPEMHHLFDFQSVKILHENPVFLHEGEENEYHIVVQTKQKYTNDNIIIYIVQLPDIDFHGHMIRSLRLLDEKYKMEVIPFVIVNKTVNNKQKERISQQRNVKFRYFLVCIQKENWRQYVQQNNPIIAAILHKMDYTEKERTQLTIGILRMIIRMQVKPEERRLMYEFFAD